MNPDKSGRRKLALVTGASAGLGEAFARAYAARGLDVALVARREDRLQTLGAELTATYGIDSLVIAGDLAAFEAHEGVLAVLARRGRVADVLVNNAGFGIPQSFLAVPWSRQRDFLMTMAVAPCGLAHGVLPGMLERGGGSIINISSLAAFSPGVAGNSLYPGVKNLMLRFTQSLAAEYGARGIKATAVCPGFTKTEFATAAGIQDVMESEPRLLWQSAETVAEITVRANERGQVVVVPGWHNKLAVALMTSLPGPIVQAMIAAGSAKYHPDD